VLAEKLGFDDIWVPEQHFSPYCLCEFGQPGTSAGNRYPGQHGSPAQRGESAGSGAPGPPGASARDANPGEYRPPAQPRESGQSGQRGAPSPPGTSGAPRAPSQPAALSGAALTSVRLHDEPRALARGSSCTRIHPAAVEHRSAHAVGSAVGECYRLRHIFAAR
jgi:hypothetical protein